MLASAHGGLGADNHDELIARCTLHSRAEILFQLRAIQKRKLLVNLDIQGSREIVVTSVLAVNETNNSVIEQRCRGYVGSLQEAEPMKLSPTDLRTKVAIIRTILQHDAQIRALTEPRMHELQQRLAMTRTARHGLDAYGAQRA